MKELKKFLEWKRNLAYKNERFCAISFIIFSWGNNAISYLFYESSLSFIVKFIFKVLFWKCKLWKCFSGIEFLVRAFREPSMNYLVGWTLGKMEKVSIVIFKKKISFGLFVQTFWDWKDNLKCKAESMIKRVLEGFHAISMKE